MAKSKKVVSKKAQAEAPVEVAPVPVPVPAEAPAPAQVPAPTKPVKARKEKVVETTEVKWARRLKRWQAKAEAQGVNVRALLQEALAA